ncbi:MAG TPA: radical SAM protein [Rhodospirillales bacterium]|nr:radical SAM protein [Rhodospirillales bacterium]
MPQAERSPPQTRKLRAPDIGAKGGKRAFVTLTRLKTLWFNTGSLCNISCRGCYMESTPKNDRLAYITADEVVKFLDEIAGEGLPVEEIAFTGGEPFMNPEFIPMLKESLKRGFRVLILTNAMQPMWNRRRALLALKRRYGDHITVRASIDHYTPQKHESLRGGGAWDSMMKGVVWLAGNGFNLTVAGRNRWDEDEAQARQGFAGLFAGLSLPVDASDPAMLTLFPELDESAGAPQITMACWGILGVQPESMMCAASRMVVKRKESPAPAVTPCTLLPYGARFELGLDLSGAAKTVKLNHPHCAKFCVLGGASCGAG